MSSNDLNDSSADNAVPGVAIDVPAAPAPARRARRATAAPPDRPDGADQGAVALSAVDGADAHGTLNGDAAQGDAAVSPAPVRARRRTTVPREAHAAADAVADIVAVPSAGRERESGIESESVVAHEVPAHAPSTGVEAGGGEPGGSGAEGIAGAGGSDGGDALARQRPGRRRGRRGGRRGPGEAEGFDGADRSAGGAQEEGDGPDMRDPLPDSEPVPFHASGAWLGLAEAPSPGDERAPDDDSTKLHKILADAGIGSRREMEALIEDGRVSVNGHPAHVGQRVAPSDQVKVNGRPLNRRNAGGMPRVVIYHKPAGEICTKDDPGRRPRVFEQLPRLKGARWISVGRLDLNSEGLLLFTTAGDIANRLMHPRYGWEREYAVRVLGRVDDEMHARLLAGVELEDGPASLKSIEDVGGDGANHWYRVTIAEGRNREVRRIFDAVGLTVSRLVRIRFGPVALPPRLVRGRSIELDEADVRSLVRIVRETASKVDETRVVGATAPVSGDAPSDGAMQARGPRARKRRGRGLAGEVEQRQGAGLPDDAEDLADAPAQGDGPPPVDGERAERPARPPLPSYAGRAWTSDRFEPDYDEDIEHDDERDGQLAMIKDIDKYAGVHDERVRPVGAGVNLDDDDWQPKSETAHLEGITRAVKKDVRQLRYGGLPVFGAGGSGAGQPRDPNAPRRGRRPVGKAAKGGGFAKPGGKFPGKPAGGKGQARPAGPRGPGGDAGGGGGGSGQAGAGPAGAPRPPGGGRKRRRNRSQ